jgi:hypothetical protein
VEPVLADVDGVVEVFLVFLEALHHPACHTYKLKFKVAATYIYYMYTHLLFLSKIGLNTVQSSSSGFSRPSTASFGSMVVAGVRVTYTVSECVVREFTVFLESADAQYLVELWFTSSSFEFYTSTCAGNSLLKL